MGDRCHEKTRRRRSACRTVEDVGAPHAGAVHQRIFQRAARTAIGFMGEHGAWPRACREWVVVKTVNGIVHNREWLLVPGSRGFLAGQRIIPIIPFSALVGALIMVGAGTPFYSGLLVTATKSPPPEIKPGANVIWLSG